jgi:hypothetical protein
MMAARSHNESAGKMDKVLLNQADRLTRLRRKLEEDAHELDEIDDCIEDTRLFLAERGVEIDTGEEPETDDADRDIVLSLPSWDQMVVSAEDAVANDRSIDELLNEDELRQIDAELHVTREEFDRRYRLDGTDIAICVVAGLMSAIVDTALVGIPQRSPEGLKARPIGDWVWDKFKEWFPPEEMERLANTPEAKTPYDAPYNTNFTEIDVEGLWPAMHRMYSVGHDPLLGLVVGTHDILRGEMTTIDKFGNIVVQKIPRYAGREETQLFVALGKQVLHMKTDVNTAMGLPAPFASVFNLLQFGNIGEEGLTVAEVAQGMYYEGYDFVHFCAQTLPVMLTEVIVRLCYFAKRIKEGFEVKDSIPVSNNREKHPKLGTMLFVAHAAATATNTGKVCFTKNPMEINYPQWIAFAGYSISQAKWSLAAKPGLRHDYVLAELDAEIGALGKRSDERMNELVKNYGLICM